MSTSGPSWEPPAWESRPWQPEPGQPEPDDRRARRPGPSRSVGGPSGYPGGSPAVRGEQPRRPEPRHRETLRPEARLREPLRPAPRHRESPRPQPGREEPLLLEEAPRRRAAEPTDRFYEDDGEGPPQVWAKVTALTREQQVSLAAIALIVASLIWKGVFLSHFNFRQDDFWLMDTAARYGLKWQYVGRVWSGQFIPGGYVIGWVLMKIAVYNWTVAVVAELASIALASVAAWRLFRNLLGNRPAILIPLALYVLSGLTYDSASWWISAVETIPLQIAIFTSLNAHVSYIRTGRFRHAAAAAAWLIFGLMFFEKSAVIPVLLFAVTAGFLVKGRFVVAAIWRTAVDWWYCWALYLAVLAGYLVAFFLRDRGTGMGATAPSSPHLAFTFARSLTFNNLVPGMLGGPWAWTQGSTVAGGNAAPPTALVWVALLVVAVVVIVSVLVRWRAWRGWAILLGWFVADDFLPVLLGRVDSNPDFAVVAGWATRYVADISAVLAIVVALVFWPVSPGPRQERASRPREFFRPATWRRAAIALLAVFALGSVWTVSQYPKSSPVTTGAYLANARAALADVPAATVVADAPVPNSVMIPFYGSDSDTSVVLRPLESSATRSHIRWVSHFDANIDHLKMVDPSGKLLNAGVAGTRATAAGCARFRGGVTWLRFAQPPGPFTTVLRIGYLAGPAVGGHSITVRYSKTALRLPLKAGLNSAYFSVSGTATGVTISAPVSAGLCIGDAEAGDLAPLPS